MTVRDLATWWGPWRLVASGTPKLEHLVPPADLAPDLRSAFGEGRFGRVLTSQFYLEQSSYEALLLDVAAFTVYSWATTEAVGHLVQALDDLLLLQGGADFSFQKTDPHTEYRAALIRRRESETLAWRHIDREGGVTPFMKARGKLPTDTTLRDEYPSAFDAAVLREAQRLAAGEVQREWGRYIDLVQEGAADAEPDVALLHALANWNLQGHARMLRATLVWHELHPPGRPSAWARIKQRLAGKTSRDA